MSSQRSLENDGVDDGLVEAIDSDGNTLGYLARSDIHRLGLRTVTHQPARRFIRDPMVAYHATMAFEQGILTSGKDLNAVQQMVLLGHIIRQREEQGKRDEARFLEQVLITNPQMYQAITKEKEEQELLAKENDEVVWKTPASMEEMEDIIEALRELDAEEGSSDSPYSADDFEGMAD